MVVRKARRGRERKAKRRRNSDVMLTEYLYVKHIELVPTVGLVSQNAIYDLNPSAYASTN